MTSIVRGQMKLGGCILYFITMLLPIVLRVYHTYYFYVSVVDAAIRFFGSSLRPLHPTNHPTKGIIDINPGVSTSTVPQC
jgi:hypothetical protein